MMLSACLLQLNGLSYEILTAKAHIDVTGHRLQSVRSMNGSEPDVK